MSEDRASRQYLEFIGRWRKALDDRALPSDFPQRERITLLMTSEAATGDESLAKQLAWLVTHKILSGERLDRFEEAFLLLALERIRQSAPALRVVAGNSSTRGPTRKGQRSLALTFKVLEYIFLGESLNESQARCATEMHAGKESVRRAWRVWKPSMMAAFGLPRDADLATIRALELPEWGSRG